MGSLERRKSLEEADDIGDLADTVVDGGADAAGGAVTVDGDEVEPEGEEAEQDEGPTQTAQDQAQGNL